MVDEPNSNTVCTPYNRITSDDNSSIYANSAVIKVYEYDTVFTPSLISDQQSILTGHANMISG